MSVGKLINELIMDNIRIWHNDTLVRHDKTLSLEEKAKLFLKSRVFNSIRSNNKFKVDKFFKCGFQDTKLNYYKEE